MYRPVTANSGVRKTPRVTNLQTNFMYMREVNNPSDPKVGRGQLWAPRGGGCPIFTDSLDVDYDLCGDSINIREEGVALVNNPYNILDFIGTTVSVSLSGNTANITISPGNLSQVLTVGDNANSLNIENLGELNFDTAGPKGIEIGTAAASAVTSLANHVAIGGGATAAGSAGIAIGDTGVITATGTNGNNITIGGDNVISGTNTERTTVLGNGSTASKADSVVIGSSSETTGVRSVVVGQDASVTANDSVAIGYSSSVSGANALALGDDTTVTSTWGLAIGSGTSTLGTYNLVIGKDLSSPTGGSHTWIGNNLNYTNIGDAASINIGRGNTGEDATFIIGTDCSAANGDSSTLQVVLGSSCTADFNNVIAIGDTAVCNETKSIAIGTSSIAQEGCVAVGDGVTITNGIDNYGIGKEVIVSTSSTYNKAIGTSANITGTAASSVVIGRASSSTHNSSVSIGQGTSSSANNEITLGNSTTYIKSDFTTSGTAGASQGYLEVNISGTTKYIPLYAVS